MSVDTPFHDLARYYALPRVEGLALSPDGTTVVVTVATLMKDATGYERALWSLPSDGSGAPTRLTRSAKGEGGPTFTASGDLLFVSARPSDDDDEAPQLWLLPATGGEARPITRIPGGVSGVNAVADEAETVVVDGAMLHSASTFAEDARVRAERKKKKVSAILHEGYPVRYWDSDLGPDESHEFALDLSGYADALPGSKEAADLAAEESGADDESDAEAFRYPAHLPAPRDLTPEAFAHGGVAGLALSPDGTHAVASLRVNMGRDLRYRLVGIDTATGAHTVITDEKTHHSEAPVYSHDGQLIAYVRDPLASPESPGDQELWVSSPAGSNARRLAEGWDRWPSSLAFASDDTALIVTADDNGRGPIFRIPLDGSAPEQLTHDNFSYTSVRTDRTGADLFALRSNWITPPHPVRIAPDGTVTELATPAPSPAHPGTMTEVETVAEDGARVRGWLLLPDGASPDEPAPLLLWIHGGPLGSWNAWSWRWSPLLMVAKGYAVLLPDPALSTGYGLEFIARGWNSWGGKPYTDLMAITDETLTRADLDADRTAAMGGSFGGYMANWVAGHTDRFDAIVTHASLWALEQFQGTTDMSPYWQRTFTPEGAAANSPHQFVKDIVTPMLVIHGDRDYRVPIGEGLRLWSELNEHFAAEDGSLPHRFLYYPDENHWILAPQNATIWYETVFAFLAENVLGAEPSRPELLG